jgi:hypothetical protein
VIDSEISDIKNMLKSYRASLPKLNIFILGPGKNNIDPYAKKCYNKRCQIKSELKHEHKVFFPEEIYEVAQRDDLDVNNTLIFENILIKKGIDTVVMIFTLNAPGLQAEIAAFSHDHEIAEKMFVFYDSTYYKRGDEKFWYINDFLNLIDGNNGKTMSFTEDMIDSCSLLTQVKSIIEKKRVVLSILPYKKYKE